MASERIQITIEGVDAFSKAFNDLQSQLRSAQKETKAAESGFSNLQATIVTLNSAWQLGSEAIRLFGGALLGLLNTAGEFQNLRIQLEGVSGSAAGGEAAFAWLKEFNKKTPLQLGDVTKAFIKFQAVGLDPTQGLLQGTADAVAYFGGTTQEFNRAVTGMGQVAGKGVLQMEELRGQIGEAIPTAIPILAKELGVTVPKLFEMVSNGAVSSQMALEAWNRGFQEAFGGASERMMQTWSGATSNLADAWNLFLDAAARTGILSIATSVVQAFTSALAALGEWLDDTSVSADTYVQNIERLDIAQTKLAMQGVAKTLAAIQEQKKGYAELDPQFVTLRHNLLLLSQHYANLTSEQIKGTAAFDGYARALDLAKLDELAIEIPIVGEATKRFNAALIDTLQELDQLAENYSRLADLYGAPDSPFGAGADAAAVALDLVSGNVVQLTGSLASLGDALSSTRGVQEQVQDSGFKVADAMGGAADEADRLNSNVVTVQRSLLSLLGPLGNVISQFQQFSQMQQESGAFGDSLSGVTDNLSGMTGVALDPAMLAGVGGAIMALLAQNPAFQEMLQKLIDAINELITPLVEAIGPALDALIPALIELKPAIILLARMIALQMDPVVFQLKILTKVITWLIDRFGFLNKWGRELTSASQRLKDKIQALIKPIEKLIKAVESIGNIGGGGGGGIVGDIGDAVGFAHGGRPPVNRMSIVGEDGPELFVPDQPGTIIPNGVPIGGTPITVNVYAYDARASAAQIVRVIEEQISLGRLRIAGA